MRITFAAEPFPHETTCSLFLMGPTARGNPATMTDWRAEALRLLETHGFKGDVFVPEPRDGVWTDDYARQIAWEDAALHRADHILVWLPRRMDTLPGLTTNDEWGYWKSRDPARLMLGVPADAENVRYQRYYATGLGIPVFDSLEAMCGAVARQRGEPRQGGECQVPLHIWRTPAFQAWHAAQKNAGNVLHGARVEWVFRVKPTLVFAWALHVDIFVAAEGRHKSNEMILGRPDIAAVVIYRRAADFLDTEIVLVREFRSPSRTPDGCIWELPSGSTFARDRSGLAVAVDEVKEELGLTIDPRTLRAHGARQLAGTLSVHQGQVFSLELSAEAMAQLRAQDHANTTHGNVSHSEVTTTRVRRLREILAEPHADWSTLGMILSVLLPPS
ncbi:MAG: NUDIX hydrolase [Planctomycetes bacterium]|nr:NUDIX hydrolase [Planctomycetota bacterium]